MNWPQPRLFNQPIVKRKQEETTTVEQGCQSHKKKRMKRRTEESTTAVGRAERGLLRCFVKHLRSVQ
jgi:hypothetical protein